MKILVLSFFYSPDLSAGSFRTTALVQQLRNQQPAGVHIDVMTTQPNRYNSYHLTAPEVEEESGFRICRIALPKHQSGMIDQGLAFLHFAREVKQLIRRERYTLVYATSSRLMIAVLGAWIAKRHGARFYLDVRDLFVDTIKDVLPRYLIWPAQCLFSALEYWAFNAAHHINLVSRGFESYLKIHYPNKRSLSWFTSGIDPEFLNLPISNHTSSATELGFDDNALSEGFCPAARRNLNDQPILTVLYAGNIGDGQGLHRIIPPLAQQLRDKVKFRIIGDGGRRIQLQAALEGLVLDNVEWIPPMSRSMLLNEYQQADILFIHLNDYPAFKKVLPSKIFEYAALGKPIWAGLSGYAAAFMAAEVGNVGIFAPCDVNDAMQKFSGLSFNHQTRTDFIQKYKREPIMQAMAQSVFSCLVDSGECTQR